MEQPKGNAAILERVRDTRAELVAEPVSDTRS